MPVRAKIIVKGWVQKVGFRTLVSRIALKLNIDGFVKNLKDRRFVEIVCEAEKEKIKKFVQAIRKEAIPPVRIDDIKIKYSKPTSKFKTFKDIRGYPQEEMFESLEAGMQHMFAMRKDLSKQMDKGFSGVKTEIKTNFTRLDKKYDVFSQRMIEIAKKMDETNRNINETNKTNAKLVNRMGDLVEEFIRQRRER